MIDKLYAAAPQMAHEKLGEEGRTVKGGVSFMPVLGFVSSVI